MNIIDLDEYTKEDHDYLLKKYKKKKKKDREFEPIFGNELQQDDFFEFQKNKKVTTRTMALFLNIIQNYDQNRFEKSKSMFIEFVEINYQAKDFQFKLITENLIMKTLKEDETLYLVVVVHKDKKGLLGGKTWQMQILRIPTRQLRLFMNCHKLTDIEHEWEYVRKVIKKVHQKNFQSFQQDFEVVKSDDSDGGVALLNVLYKFITGQELDMIFKIPGSLNYDEFHKKLTWQLLKIQDGTGIFKHDKNRGGLYDDYKYEHPVEIYLGDEYHPKKSNYQPEIDDDELDDYPGRVLNKKKEFIIKHANKTDRNVQTFYSIDPDFQIPANQFGNQYTKNFAVMKDGSSQTMAYQIPQIKKMDTNAVHNFDRPYFRNHVSHVKTTHKPFNLFNYTNKQKITGEEFDTKNYAAYLLKKEKDLLSYNAYDPLQPKIVKGSEKLD